MDKIFDKPLHLTGGDRTLKVGDLIAVFVIPNHFPPRSIVHIRNFSLLSKERWYPAVGVGFRIKSLK